jgi:hypothetical protein
LVGHQSGWAYSVCVATANTRVASSVSNSLPDETPSLETGRENDSPNNEDTQDAKPQGRPFVLGGSFVGLGIGVTALASEYVSFLFPKTYMDTLQVLITTGSAAKLTPCARGGCTRITLSSRCRLICRLGMAALRARPSFSRNLTATRRTRGQRHRMLHCSVARRVESSERLPALGDEHRATLLEAWKGQD